MHKNKSMIVFAFYLSFFEFNAEEYIENAQKIRST